MIPKLTAETLESDALERVRTELSKKGIDARLIKRSENIRSAVTGVYKSEPFVVYFRFIEDRQNAAGIVVTRYKGKDQWGKTPYEILKGG